MRADEIPPDKYDQSKAAASETSPNFTPDNDPQMAERRDKALSLRAAGFSFSKIGKALGISKQGAYKMVMKEVRSQRLHTAEKAVELRHISHVRTEVMINRLYLKAMPNDPKEPMDYMALDRMIRLMVFHARLMGYEEPQRLQVDINEVRTSFAFIIEKITKVIPEDSAPKVLAVFDSCLVDMQRKQDAAARQSPISYSDVTDPIDAIIEEPSAP